MIGKVKIPSLSFLILYILGIVLSRQFPFFFDSIAAHLGVAMIVGFAAFVLYLSVKDYKTYTLPATLMVVIVFTLFGYYRTANYHALSKSDHYSHVDQASIYIGTITDLPTLGKSVKCLIEITSVGSNPDSMYHASGELLTYFVKDSLSISLAPGDVVVFDVKQRSVQANANPLVFDYKQYLDNRNIHFQGYVDAESWVRVSREALPWYFQKAASLRKYSLGVIDRHIDEIDSKAVLSAMLLGVRSLISDELYDAYTDTGAVHVLAVSGLHVGIFTLILYWFFGLFPIAHPAYKWAKLILILFVVWGFVLVTGAAPAVTRAAMMSSLVIVAHTVNKQVNTYNVLAITALVMLLWNPLMLYQASFQFSFLALLSILFFMPILIGYFTPSHSLLQKVMGLLYVSIAAQVLVLPLTIFFFHKLATYFWLSGLFVVLAAFIILCLGLLLLIFDMLGQHISLFDWINEHALGPVLDKIIWLNNWLISLIQQLPKSAVDGIWLSKIEVVVLYLGIGICMVAFTKRSGWTLIAGMLVFLGFTIQRIGWNHRIDDNQSIFIYDVYGRSLVDIFHQDEVYSIPESSDPELVSKNTFIRGNNRYAHGVDPVDGLPEFCHQVGPILSVGEQVILFAGHDSIYQQKTKIPVDFAIVQNNYVVDIGKLKEHFDIRHIIVDGTNRYQTKRETRQQCYQYKMPYRDTQYGAIEITY